MLTRNIPIDLSIGLALGAVLSMSVFGAEKPVSYYGNIRPILQANCQGCHQPAKDKGDYVMTDFASMLAGGESEKKAIVPGDLAKSHLVELITANAKGEVEMPKGKTLLSSSEVAMIKKWIAAGAIDDTPANARASFDVDHPPVYTLPPVITSLDYSPDGKLLAVAGFHEVLLHKADGSGLVARLIGMSERIESVRFSPDGKQLAVTGGNPARMGEVQIWDVAKEKLVLSHSVTFDTVYGACWSPDGKHLSFGCADNSVRAIEVKTGKQVFFQGAHTDWVFDTVFDTKGEHLISVGRGMTAKLTVFKTSRFIDNITSITPKALKGGLAAVTRHPTREHILVGGADGAPQLFRIFRQTKRVIGDNANLIRKFPDMPGRVFSVRYSKDGSIFAAGSGLDGKGQVVIYSANTPDKIPDDIKKIQAKRVKDRKGPETIKLDKFHTDGIKQLAKVDIGDSGIYAVAVSPDGKTVAAAGSDGRVRLINAADGKVAKAFVPVKVENKGVAKSTVKAAAPKPDIPEKETLPKDATVVTLTIEPRALALTSPIDYAQVLVNGCLAEDPARGQLPSGVAVELESPSRLGSPRHRCRRRGDHHVVVTRGRRHGQRRWQVTPPETGVLEHVLRGHQFAESPVRLNTIDPVHRKSQPGPQPLASAQPQQQHATGTLVEDQRQHAPQHLGPVTRTDRGVLAPG
jgi:WD40 repeat protein